MAHASREAKDPSVSPGSAAADLLQRIASEIEAQNYEEALRWADRASRLSGRTGLLDEIIGRIYARIGRYDRAVISLRHALEQRPSPSLQAVLIDVLFDMGRPRHGFSALEAGLGRFAVRLGEDLAACARRHTLVRGRGAPGWVGVGPDLQVVGEIRDDLEGRLTLFGADFETAAPTLELMGEDEVNVLSFRAPAPTGFQGRLNAAVGGGVLVGSDLAYPPDFGADGRASITDGVLSGWAGIGWIPELPPTLVLGRNTHDVIRLQASPSAARDGRHPFEVDLRPLKLASGAIDVAIELPSGRYERLPDSPALAELPPTPLGVGRGPSPRPPRALVLDNKVDIIIPVFRGLEETVGCLDAVRRCSQGAALVIVIDDASPDEALRAHLRRAAQEGEINLVTNAANLGFAGSVNWGLGVHPDRDSIILHADTEVYPGWIERLRRAAYSAPDIGTVTPLCNQDPFASYPSGEGSYCTRNGGERLALIAAEVNDGVLADAPTGSGFCLYIRQDCRAATGLFDTEAFGRGYGEEIDFCLRARRLGWRHVIAADVFVRRLDGPSFGADRPALRERNLRLVARRHPDFQGLAAEFVAKDPLSSARRRIDERRLLDEDGPRVLLVTLALPGGVETFIQGRRASLSQNGAVPLVMRPGLQGGSVVLQSDNQTLTSLTYGPNEVEDLLEVLRSLRLSTIELHHYHDLPELLVEALFDLGVPVDVYLHDYSLICPRFSLLGGEGKYCGEPDVSACESCVAQNGAMVLPSLTARALRARSAGWLKAASRIVAPLEDVRERLLAYFPEAPIEVAPWETERFPPSKAAAPPPDRPVRVALIGALGPWKGFELIDACARDAVTRGLGIEFIVLGFTFDDDRLMQSPNVFVTGRYDEAEIQGLIDREKPDLAFISSVAPETWCFALSHALRAGLPILAFDLGAVPERLRGTGVQADLLPLTLDPAAINEAILRACGRGSIPADRRLVFGAAMDGPGEDVPSIFTDLPARGSVILPEVFSKDLEQRSEVARSPGMTPLDQEDQMAGDTRKPRASVQIMSLPSGLYRFSVTAATEHDENAPGVPLPAVQISSAPGVSAKSVEYMSSPGMDGVWLYQTHATIIARITIDETPLFITSYSLEDGEPLQLEVNRIDGDPRRALKGPPATPRLGSRGGGSPPLELGRGGAPSAVVGASLRRTEDGRVIVPTRITAHISRNGDVSFVDKPYVGIEGQTLQIESFMIEPLATLAPTDLEYKALTEKGVETPWTTGGIFCGTRGLAVALSGFAVRVAGAKAKSFECRYSGVFMSGRRVGPVADGAPLHSGSLDDYLVGMEIAFFPRNPAPARGAQAAPPLQTQGPSAPPSPPLAGLAERPREPARPAPAPRAAAPVAASPSLPIAPNEPPPRRTVGPRFSIFREDED